MGSKRIGQVRFRAISGDHAGGIIPHLHADIGSGEVVVELIDGGGVRLSNARRGPIQGKVSANEARIVLRTAEAAYGTLLTLWEASRLR